MIEKTLIVYYSRSGISEKVAQTLQAQLGCDMDKLEYAEKKHISFGAAVIEALRKSTAPITGGTHKPENYGRIIFITPVWGSGLATPIRSYMTEHKTAVQSYALIVTCGGGGLSGTIKDAAAILGKEPSASEQFRSSQVNEGHYGLEQFVQ
ncbi:MAG: hypothetical protein LBG90_05150 [Spirochaetaceae bacterium]|jgi:flavodoxin|nr:hypothetical protein [Spirochaetaceae bacterium]